MRKSLLLFKIECAWKKFFFFWWQWVGCRCGGGDGADDGGGCRVGVVFCNFFEILYHNRKKVTTRIADVYKACLYIFQYGNNITSSSWLPLSRSLLSLSRIFFFSFVIKPSIHSFIIGRYESLSANTSRRL